MAVSLPDVNVLIALASEDHVHHDVADAWFVRNRVRGWATCPLTQLAFLRLVTQPAVVDPTISMADARELLAENMAAADHEFWPLDYSVTDIIPEIGKRIVGHNQLTDALLLDLAIRRQGRLATFDQRVRNLLEPQSQHLACLEILSGG